MHEAAAQGTMLVDLVRDIVSTIKGVLVLCVNGIEKFGRKI